MLLFTDLPTELILQVAYYLQGLDTFHLSHANTRLFQLLSSDSIWKRFIGPPTSKERFIRDYSFIFRGGHGEEHRRQTDYGDAIVIPNKHFKGLLQRNALSFDMWLTSSVDGQNAVIVGLQSSRHQSGQWPYYHQQFVTLKGGELFATINTEIVRPLGVSFKCNQWYHLALTYDGGGTERVYLNGCRISESLNVRPHHEIPMCRNYQIGSGCLTLTGPHDAGWYPFRGAIDNLRIWERELTPSEVSLLASNDQVPSDFALNIKSMRNNRTGNLYRCEKLRCTRPLETQFETYSK